MKKLIELEELYSIDQIIKGGFLPWIKSSTAIRLWIQTDIENNNYLNTKSKGTGKGRRYWIRGRDITNIISMFDKGTLFLKEKNGKIRTKKIKS